MKRIWQITYDFDTFLFEDYAIMVASIQQSFDWKAPLRLAKESETGDNTVMGLTTPNGKWLQIKAIVVNRTPINITK